MNRPAESSELPTISGKLLIISVGVVAIGGALFAWWFRWQEGHAAREFWGPPVIALLGDTDAQIEFYQLEPAGDSAPAAQDSLEIDGARYRIAARTPGENIHGLLHLRSALTQDKSFAFAEPSAAGSAPWPYAMRVASTSDEATLLFDPAHRRVGLAGGGTATITVALAESLQEFLGEEGLAPATTQPPPGA